MTTTPGIQGNGWNVVMGGISDRNKQTWAMDGVANDTTGDQNDNPNFFEVVQVTTSDGGADNARAAAFILDTDPIGSRLRRTAEGIIARDRRLIRGRPHLDNDVLAGKRTRQG